MSKGKTDAELGVVIQGILIDKGIETPVHRVFEATGKTGWLDVDTKHEFIAHHFKEIMKEMRLDLRDDSLKDTPNRLAKMFLQEVFVGLDYANFPKITMCMNKMKYDNMLVERDIAVKSYCEHHFVAIDGVASIAYIPGDNVVGLSKLNRVVDFFSRRPQVQERLTEQIHATLVHILKVDDVAVVINAVHHCVKHRGIQDANSSTVTSKLSGAFKKDPATRAEFMRLSGIK